MQKHERNIIEKDKYYLTGWAFKTLISKLYKELNELDSKKDFDEVKDRERFNFLEEQINILGDLLDQLLPIFDTFS